MINFEFYEFNTANILVLLISTLITYLLFTNLFLDKKEENELSIKYLFIAVIISGIISLLYAYYSTNSNEEILKINYWDPLPSE